MTYGRRPPLDEQKSLWEASLGPEGVTTGAGAITGDSFIDARLIGVGADSFVSMLAVIYPGQPRNVDSMDITAFNNATGEVTLAKAYKGVAAAIPIGVPYKIVTFRFVPAEVAALTTLVNTVLTRMGVPAGASISVDIAALKTALDGLGLQYVEGSVDDVGPAAADFDTDLTEATDNHYNGMLLMFTDGDCAGQAHVINDYAGATKNVSFSAEDLWTDVPGDGDNFIILPGTGSMAKAIYTRLGAPAGASIAADLVTIAAYLDTEIAAIITSQSRMLFTLDFWSDPAEEKAITAAQVTAAVGAAVTVHDLPGGATVVIAKIMFKFRMVENTNVAENSLDCTAVQPIQVDDSGDTGWVTAIDFVDEQFKIAAESREGGDVIIGDNNVAARVDGNDTYDFQWLNAKAHLANIQFNDIQMGIRIWYSV